MQASSSDTLSPPHTHDVSKHVGQPQHSVSAQGSNGSFEKDIEKGDPGSNENNEVDQGAEDKRQTKEESNVVGWDGPNDPENPQVSFNSSITGG